MLKLLSSPFRRPRSKNERNALRNNAERPKCLRHPGRKPPERRFWLPAVLTLSALLASCATTSPVLPLAPVKPAAIPPLPPNARQEPVPVWCLPTCTEALTKKRSDSLKRLTAPDPAGSLASRPTTG